MQHPVRIALHDAEGWRELIKQALDETGGPLREKRQTQRDERHQLISAIDKERLKCAEAETVLKNLNAAEVYQKCMAA